MNNFLKLFKLLIMSFICFFQLSTCTFAHEEDANLYNLSTSLLVTAKQHHQKKAALSEVLEVAARRKTAMLMLLEKGTEKDIEAFLRHSLPTAVRKNLPSEAQGLVEQEEMTLQGKFYILAADYFEQGRSVITYQLVLEDQPGVIMTLHFAKHPHGHLQPGSTVKAVGVLLDSHMALAEAGGSSLKVTSSAAAAGVPPLGGDIRAVALLGNFTDAALSCTPPAVTSLLFTDETSANKYFQENSLGQITSITGDVYGPYTIPFSNTSSDYLGWARELDAAATSAGAVLSNYNLRVYVVPDGSGVTWAGLAYLSDPRSWNSGYCGTKGVYEHEWGHNLGTHHASTFTDEYGDYSDVMGRGTYVGTNGPHFVAPRKVEMGWLPSSNVQTVTATGTYTLSLLEQPVAGIQTIKIPKSDTGDYFWLGYRRPVGFDSTGLQSQFWDHTMVHQATGMRGQHTYLLGNIGDGQTFSDSINGLTVTQTSHDETAGTVTLNVVYGGPQCLAVKPEVSISPLSKTGSAGQGLNYTVTVTNKDTSVCSNTTFSFASTVPSSWTSSFSPASLQIAPGSSGSTTWTVTSPSDTPDGSYPIASSATDVADSIHMGSAGATYLVFADATAPTVSFISPTNNSAIPPNNQVYIQVSASDNVGVTRVEIWIDGVLKTTLTAPPYNYKWAAKKPTRGPHTITAKGYDAAGNEGVASITVIK